jgi:hypothetical protein
MTVQLGVKAKLVDQPSAFTDKIEHLAERLYCPWAGTSKFRDRDRLHGETPIRMSDTVT